MTIKPPPIKTMTVGEFKAQFSAVLEQIKQGETVVICHGRRREKIAALVPYRQISCHNRPLGLLQDRASCVIHEDFELGEEEFLKTRRVCWTPTSFCGRFFLPKS